MIGPAQAVRMVIATKPVDFRKGDDGLAALGERARPRSAFRPDRCSVRSAATGSRACPGPDPGCCSGTAAGWRSRRCSDRWRTRPSLYKRLEEGKFAWPAVRHGVMRLSQAQFEALFDRLDWLRVYGPRRVRPPAAAE